MITGYSNTISVTTLGYDADAQAFFNRVTAAGGTLSATEQTATNQLVLDMKSAGIWTAMRAVYPMVGASAAACAQNLKSSSFTGTFTSGWTFASTGVTPNGTSAYMDTGITNTNLIGTDYGLGFYLRTNSNGLYSDMGIGNAEVLTRLNDNLLADLPTSSQRETVANTDSRGFYIFSNSSANNYRVYKNSTAIISLTYKNVLFDSLFNLLLSTWKLAVDRFSDRQNAFAFVSSSLTGTQASNFYTAVQAFQTTLARQIAP